MGAGGLGCLLGEGGGDEGRDHPADLAGMRQHVPREVDPAALPGGRQHLGDGRLQAPHGHRRRRASSHAGRGASACAGTPSTDLHAQHLVPAVGIDAEGDDDGDGDDASAAANLQVGGVDSKVRPTPFD